MNDLKIYGINVGAVAFSAIPDINPVLQTVVLVMTIVYTGMNIYIKLKDRSPPVIRGIWSMVCGPISKCQARLFV